VPQKSQQNQPTATSVQENKRFRDRLRDRYKPLDNVRVINIDNEPFEWEYFPIDGETEEFTDNGAVRVTTGRRSFVAGYSQVVPGAEQIWEIGPGESEVLIGACADLFIEGLYKRLVAKKRIAETTVAETQARSFNWNDGLLQEQMIDKIFLGVVKPNFDELKPEPPRVGRPPKTE
jgi:hypothetical protein